MLRVLVLAMVGLTAGFAVVAGLLSREWGWSEYASDELYVVYFQSVDGEIQFFIINTNDTDQGEPLSFKEDEIRAVGCSPDGRVFAFYLSTGYVYVINSVGIIYDQPTGDFDDFYSFFLRMPITNSAEIVRNLAIGNPESDHTEVLLINAADDVRRMPPDPEGSYSGVPLLLSRDYLLWHLEPRGFQIILRDGSLIMSSSIGHPRNWLASEQIFYFNNERDRTVYIMDIPTQKIVPLPTNWELFPSALSPDGTMALVAAPPNTDSAPSQVIIAETVSRRVIRELTHSPDGASPLCFLTFRPEMLIDQSQ